MLVLFEKFCLIYFIVEQMFVVVVLIESIVIEQYRVVCQVSYYVVWLVQYWCFDKNELFVVVDIQCVVSFYYIKILFWMMVMIIYRVDSVGSIVDRCIGNLCYQFGQCFSVVFFCMVNYDVIDIRQIDFIMQVLYKFVVEFMVDGVDQYVFFFVDEVVIVVVVVQCFIFCVVKIMYFLVMLINLMNVIFYYNRYSNFNLFSVF